MEITEKGTIKLELSEEETKKYKKFEAKVNKLKKFNYKSRKDIDLDNDYLSKRSNSDDYSISITFIPNSIGVSVFVSCDTLNLKENITDYCTW